MSNLLRGGELVVKVLEEFNAKVVYGIPGGQTLFVTDPLIDTDIKFVHTRHENTAACAADGWGRITGEPGICLATTGPGATNLITGLGGALRDSSPVIALVFQNRLPDAGKGDAQESNHEQLFSSICKKYIPVRDVSTIQWAMREAYRVAKTGRPGPVVVDLYRDVIENQRAQYHYVHPDNYCIMPDSVASDDSIAKAASVIKSYKRICLWIGNGVKIAKAAEEVKELSEILSAPIVCTYNSIGTIEGEYVNLVGPRSRHGSRVAKAALEEADCVVVIGSSLTAISTNKWDIKVKNVVQFDIIPESIGRHYPVAAGVVGDARASLKKLIEALNKDEYKGDTDYRNYIFAKKAEWKKELLQGSITDVNASPAAPLALFMELEKLLKEDGAFVVDAGNPGAWTHVTNFPKGTTYMKPVNFGNMGFALGAAIGCKEACPEKEVIALLGDGSLGMTLGDLETIGREKLPIIVLLLNDDAYGNIRQEELYKLGEGRYTGVDFTEVDYLEVARSLGLEGTIVRKASELKDAFDKARADNKPHMIEVKLDGSFTVWPEVM